MDIYHLMASVSSHKVTIKTIQGLRAVREIAQMPAEHRRGT